MNIVCAEMGYLIQNKACDNYTFRLNTRIRATWVARNYILIYFIITSFAHICNFTLTATNDIFIWLKISKYVFARFPHLVCLSSKYLQQVTFGLNFPKSAHYNGCLRIHSLLKQNTVLTLSRSNVHNLYSTPISIVTMPRMRKLLKCFLYQIFKYWLNVWVLLPTSLLLPHSFVCAPAWWQFITYTNVFYFKVYNT